MYARSKKENAEMSRQLLSNYEQIVESNREVVLADNNGITLFTKGELQELQDKYSAASGLYAICFGRNEGVLTSFSGSKRDRGLIEQIIGKNYYYNVLKQIQQCDDSEEVYVGDTKYSCIKVAGVNVVIDGIYVASWIVTAIIEDDILEDELDILKYFSRTTTKVEFYKSIDFLHTVSKKLFQVKVSTTRADLEANAEKFAVERMRHELRRNRAMTNVVQLLESDEASEDVLAEALKIVGKYLDISNAFILKINPNEQTVDMVAEWLNLGVKSEADRYKNRPITDLAYIGNHPCIVSSNSDVPEYFDNYLERYGIQALVSFPIEISGKQVMNMVFQEKRAQKIWDTDTIKFLFDVKKIVQSIIVKRITSTSLESSYESLESILENMGCGIFVCDRETDTILYANQRTKVEFSKAFDQGTFVSMFNRCAKEYNGSNYMELHYKEEHRWYEVHYTQITWVDGREVSLCTAYDITDRKVYQKKIEQQANNDFLTGLYNRMRCETDLEGVIEETKKKDSKGALMYLDLDDFKSINDGLGHHYGDVLLKAISKALCSVEGVEENCYRMGGDEFIIVISDEYYDQLETIVDDIKDIFTKPWYLGGTDCYCTMSMGIVVFPQDGDNVLDVMKKADIALYEAKKRGKNCIEYYNKTSEASSYKRLDMEKNMRKATANNCKEFEVYYQPVFDMQKDGVNKCCGAEALIRWNSEQLGFIPPSEFIPLAEYLGLINPIGSFVLEKACADCKAWNDKGFDYKVNVNLSVVQLLQNDIGEKITGVLEKTGLNPKNLTLEVTESLAINDMERMKKILGGIKKQGCRIALDDFGTGYSSLNHIKEIPLDVIKVDQCFISDISDDEYALAFVKMVTELANTIGVIVCVEGVENLRQQKVLRDLKVRLHQGYYYDKPMTLEEFESKYVVTPEDIEM